MSGFPPQVIQQAKQFVDLLKSQPELLHANDLAFFKHYLESLGATIPPKPEPKKEEPKPEPKKEEPKPEPKKAEPVQEEPVEEVEEEVKDEPDPELWPADADEHVDMGGNETEVSDERNMSAMSLFF